MANEIVPRELKLVKPNSWDSMVSKLNKNKKRNKRRAIAEFMADARASEKEAAKEVRDRFRIELMYFADNKFKGEAIKNRSQLKKLTNEELRVLVEGLAEKARPWAIFQKIMIWMLVVSWLGAPITLASLSGNAAWLGWYVLGLFTHALPLFFLTESNTSRTYWNAYQAIKKLDGPKYLSYVK